MQDSGQEEVEKLAKHYNVPPEFVKAVLATKRATTMREKLDAFNRERTLFEQGDPEAVRRQHEQGKLTARERANKLLDPDSFEELNIWHSLLRNELPHLLFMTYLFLNGPGRGCKNWG